MLLQSETQALDDRISEPYGVRAPGGISLSGCHPNRAQASPLFGTNFPPKAAVHQRPLAALSWEDDNKAGNVLSNHITLCAEVEHHAAPPHALSTLPTMG